MLQASKLVFYSSIILFYAFMLQDKMSSTKTVSKRCRVDKIFCAKGKLSYGLWMQIVLDEIIQIWISSIPVWIIT